MLQKMAPLCAVLVAGLMLVSLAQANYDSDSLYDSDLFQDLYKRLSQLEDTYYPDELQLGGYGGQSDWQNIPLDSRDSGQAEIRDPEYLAHSSNSEGFQYISGGAGEGKQHLTPEGTQDNQLEVKSDEGLPFYCHPPNPCPKGFDESDGCQMNIDDSAESQKTWISQMQRRGMCSCDEEHMFDCAKGSGRQQDDKVVLDQMIDSLLGDQTSESNTPYGKGNLRQSIMAKKSPRIKRSTFDQIERELEKMKTVKRKVNPYLQGHRVHTMAKKGGFHFNEQ